MEGVHAWIATDFDFLPREWKFGKLFRWVAANSVFLANSGMKG